MTRNNQLQPIGQVSRGAAPSGESLGSSDDESAQATERQQRLLIFEQNGTTREKLATGLQRPGTEIITAATLGDAHRFISCEQPDLVLATLPSDKGIEVFTQLPVVARTTFMARCLRNYRQRVGRWLASGLPPEPAEQVLHCDCRRPPSRPVPLSLADCIPLAALTRHPLRIELVQRDECVGEVLVANGQVRACTDAEGGGEAALERLLRLERALARCVTAAPEEIPLASSVDWLTTLFVGAPPRWQKEAYHSDAPRNVDAISTDIPTANKPADDAEGAKTEERPETEAAQESDAEVAPHIEAEAAPRENETPWDRWQEQPSSLSSGIFDLHSESHTSIPAVDSSLFDQHDEERANEPRDTARVFVLEQHRQPAGESDDSDDGDIFTNHSRRMQAFGSSPFSDAMPQSRPAVPPRPNKISSLWPTVHRDQDADGTPPAPTAISVGASEGNTSEAEGAFSDAEQAFDHGLLELRAGRLSDALRAWMRASELDPDNTHYQVNLRMLRRRIDERGRTSPTN